MSALAAAAMNDVPTAIVDFSAFQAALVSACRVIERASIAPILNHVVLQAVAGGISVIGTDLGIYSMSFVPASTTPDFIAVVDARRMKAALANITDGRNLRLCRSEDKLTISTGTLNLSFDASQDVADFPEDLNFRAALKNAGCSFLLPTSRLASILRKVEVAVSTEETRYYLNGVFIHADSREKKLAFVATDGHKLALYKIDLPPGAERIPERGAIIPHKTVSALRHLAGRKGAGESTMVSVAESAVSFLIGENDLLESKLIDGSYPDYTRVVPVGNKHKIAVSKAPFLSALRQVAAVKAKDAKAVALTFSGTKLAVSAGDGDDESAAMEISVVGETRASVGFNASYLQSILRLLDGGALLEIENAIDPAVIRDAADGAVTYVLMPMRV